MCRLIFRRTLPPAFVDATLTRQALFKITRLMIQNSQAPISLIATPNDNFIVLQLRNPDCAHSLQERDWQAAQRIIHDRRGKLGRGK